MSPRVSVIIPVYNEGEAVVGPLTRVLDCLEVSAEVLVVYDSLDDTTVPFLDEVARKDDRVVPLLNTFGPGPAMAMRFGFENSQADVVVVTMADGCDDPRLIEPLVFLVERGVVVAAASRYMHGGQQVGGPFLKGMMSRTAGRLLYLFARVGTHDATNSFKAYDREFVKQVGVESDGGFEMGIELVAKARRHRLPVAELPTIWLDRDVGTSNFKMAAWLQRYLRWFRYSFGGKIS